MQLGPLFLTKLNRVTSSNSGAYTLTNTLADVTNLSVTINCRGGRPVHIYLVPTVLGGISNCVALTHSASTGGSVAFGVFKDGVQVVDSLFKVAPTSSGVQSRWLAPGLVYIDENPTAGNHTYKIQASYVSATGGTFGDFVLVAEEIL